MKKRLFCTIMSLILILGTIPVFAAADRRELASTGDPAPSLSAPVLIRCENTVSGQRVIWKPTAGASAYRVYVNTDSKWDVAVTTLSTSFTNTRAVSGKRYTYTVRCWNKTTGKPDSDFDHKGVSGVFVASPKIKTFNAVKEGVDLKWTACKGAKYYAVFRNTSKGWKQIAVTAQTSYNDKTVYTSTRYTYTVRCMNASRKFNSAFNKSGWSFTRLPAPNLTSIGYRNKKYIVKWKAQSSAAKYRVYRKTPNGNWKVVGTSKTNSYTDASVKANATYAYAVRALGASGNCLSYINTSPKYFRNGVRCDSGASKKTTEQYEAEALRLINAERKKRGLALFKKDSGAVKVARLRAKEIAKKYSHTRPNGSSCFTAATQYGVTFHTAGENIGRGFETPAEMVNDWMNSSVHRSNIISKAFSRTGIGCYISGGRLYWTQFFIG